MAKTIVFTMVMVKPNNVWISRIKIKIAPCDQTLLTCVVYGFCQ